MIAPIVIINPVTGCPPSEGPPSDFAVGQSLYYAGCPIEWCNDKDAGEWLGWVAAEKDATPAERESAARMAAHEEWRRETD